MTGPCCCPNFLIFSGPLLLLLILLLLHTLVKNISVTDHTSCSIYSDCTSPAPWRRSFKRKSHKHLGSSSSSTSSTKLCRAPVCVSLFSPNPLEPLCPGARVWFFVWTSIWHLDGFLVPDVPVVICGTTVSTCFIFWLFTFLEIVYHGNCFLQGQVCFLHCVFLMATTWTKW